MFNYQLDFERPAYLLLLLLIPVLWFWGRRGLSAISSWRRTTAFLLRAAVVTAIALALAEVHLVRTNDRLAVIYLVDRSLSVAPEEAQAAIDFINRSRAAHRDRARGDLAGVIVFGREAAVELPPLDEDLPLVQIEATVDRESTDLAAALRLARACLPDGYSKRIVILSDGNETAGSALEEARRLVDAEVGIDVVPLRRLKTGDVAVDKIAVPVEVRRGTPFEVRVVLDNAQSGNAADKPVKGRLRVSRRVGAREELVTEQTVELEPGKRVFTFQDELASSDFYTYDAQFLPDDPAGDGVAENNLATGFTQVQGNGRVLLIEDWSHAGEHNLLVERLRASNIEVDVQPSNQLFANLAELQRYDTVVLANVPRISGDEADDVSQFGDEQIDMLVRNTEQMGSGLVMLGGDNSFGAGGWTNTELEKAMPVDFQISNAKVVPVGALVLVLDRSGSMSGEKINMSKSAAIAALRALGPRDYIGVVVFDSAAEWLAPIQHVGNGVRVASRVSTLGADGGTNMMPGVTEGYRALEGVQAGAKHLIALTDGLTNGAGYEALAARMRQQGITTTCVAIGADSDTRLMQGISRAGGGKFYSVQQPKTIPRIFMKEARRVARPLVYENANGIPPQIALRHDMLTGIDSEALPAITGFVMTKVKDNPLVEVPLASPQPLPGSHALLAGWTYGLGRAVALTTDAGQRWSKGWTSWEHYDRLFSQVVRWSMRPNAGDGKLTGFAEAKDGMLRVVVTALDKDDQFLNFLSMRGTVVGPSLEAKELSLEQIAPGRYVGQCPLGETGNYFVTVVPSRGMAPLRTGVSLPHASEFRNLRENRALLTRLAGQAPSHGRPGRVIDVADPQATLAADANVFRRDLPKAVARRPFWPLVILAAACLFFVDVFNRRVMVSLAPVGAAAKRIAGALWKRGAAVLPTTESIDRLRSRKDEIARELDDRRAAARFEPAPKETSLEALDEANAAVRPTTSPKHAAVSTLPDAEEDSYTERLLKAKRSVTRKNSSSEDAA